MDEITLSRFKMTKPKRTQMAVLSGGRGGGSHINVTGVPNDSITPSTLKGISQKI